MGSHCEAEGRVLTKNLMSDIAMRVSATAEAPSHTPTIDSNFLNSMKGGTLTTAIDEPRPPTWQSPKSDGIKYSSRMEVHTKLCNAEDHNESEEDSVSC